MASQITPEQIAARGAETSHQQALFAWAALNRPEYSQLQWMHAIPNANSHHQIAEGVRSGVPDVCLPFPVRWHHGMYIEMKKEIYRTRKRGGRSPEQDQWIDYLTSAGYYVVTCYNWQEARDAILEYLTGASHGTPTPNAGILS